MRVAVSPTLRIATGLLLAVLLSVVGYQVFRQSSFDAPEALLKQADEMSWLNSWIEAEPLYRQAEQEFTRRHQLSKALYARVSQMPAHSESSTSIPSQIALLRRDLDLPEAKDPDRIAAIVWKKEPQTNNLGVLYPQAVESFSLSVQNLLEAWKYPDLTRVTFSQENNDLIISGKDRASEGKGFRAIANAAFMIGLLNYCSDAEMKLAHPGIVVLDSPLVTYKRRDTAPGEEISEDITTAFYQDLVDRTAKLQIIVLENNDPPPELQLKMRYTHFSRSSVGRYGFFPLGQRAMRM